MEEGKEGRRSSSKMIGGWRQMRQRTITIEDEYIGTSEVRRRRRRRKEKKDKIGDQLYIYIYTHTYNFTNLATI